MLQNIFIIINIFIFTIINVIKFTSKIIFNFDIIIS